MADANKQKELQLSYAFDWGVNLKHRTILLNEEIDEESFKIVDTALTEMEKENGKAVTIKLCSMGGSPYDAMAIVGRIRSSNCTVRTEGFGCVMSAATLILAAGDKRKMSHYSFFMHHESSYGVKGRHSTNKATIAQFEKEEQIWSQWMAEFSNKPKAWWLKQGTATDAYFTAEELLKYGVIDEVF